MPPEQRTPLIKAQLGHHALYQAYNGVLERGRYVLVKENDVDLLLYTKTNAALVPAGSVTLHNHYGRPYDQGMHAFATYQDHLFQLHTDRRNYARDRGGSLKLRSFKKRGEIWIECKHPARHLWEVEGRILGMRQLSESKILLLVLSETTDLLQAINLSDGSIELSTMNMVSKRQISFDKIMAIEGRDSTIFDMDAFGLIIVGRSRTLQHFCFERKEQTWQIVFEEGVGRIRKARKVTVFACNNNFDEHLAIVDNASGVIKRRLRMRDYGVASSSRSRGIEVIRGDDYLFFGTLKDPESLSLEVYNIAENRMMSFPLTIPEINLDYHCLMRVDMMSMQSKTTVLYTVTIENFFSVVLWSGVVWLNARQPGRTIALSHPEGSGLLIGCVSGEHGFFAINDCQCEIRPSCYALESWKY